MPEQKVLLSRSEIVIFVAEDRHGMGWMMSVQGNMTVTMTGSLTCVVMLESLDSYVPFDVSTRRSFSHEMLQMLKAYMG
jgi:hypothetical protein